MAAAGVGVRQVQQILEKAEIDQLHAVVGAVAVSVGRGPCDYRRLGQAKRILAYREIGDDIAASAAGKRVGALQVVEAVIASAPVKIVVARAAAAIF